jgi:HSP20 family molecular chaperone IbpA
MKTPTPERAIAPSAVQRGAKRNPAGREQLPLRDLPDCLLAAYEGVSQRARERSAARGSRAQDKNADWRAAERDLFLPIAVDFQDTEKFLYALAAVTGLKGTQIAIAIEDSWLLISGHPTIYAECDDAAVRPTDFSSHQLATGWVDWHELDSVPGDSETSESPENSEFAEEEEEFIAANEVKAQPFCVVELPVRVDIARSVAVFSDGLIAIRMPKTPSAAPGR